MPPPQRLGSTASAQPIFCTAANRSHMPVCYLLLRSVCGLDACCVFFPKQRVQAAKPPCERERAGGREDRPPPLPLPLRASAVGCSARDTASPRPGLSQRLTSSVPEMTTTRQPGPTARLCRAIVFMTDVAARIPSARAEPPWCAAPLPSLLFCPS